jgi:hypothetical protein
MRLFAVAPLLFLAACSHGRVMVTGESGDVRIAFKSHEKDVATWHALVVELDDKGRLGGIVCDLTLLHGVGTRYRPGVCAALIPGRSYGVVVSEGRCMISTRFTVAEGGSVLDLGPHKRTCPDQLE